MSKSQQRRKATMKPAFGKKQNVGVQNGTFIYNGPMTLDQLCKRLGISASDTIKNFLIKGNSSL